MAALSGEVANAASILDDITRRCWPDLKANIGLFARALGAAITAGYHDCAAALINRRYDTDGWFKIGCEENAHPHQDVVRWEIRDRTSSVLWFDSRFAQSAAFEPIVFRLASLLPLLTCYREHEDFAAGSVFLNLGDVGFVPGLAFCDNRSEYFLIPDAEFVLHRGYARMRPGGAVKVVPWHERQSIAFWRGGTTGRPRDASLGWRSLPRIELCEISQAHPDILDAGISHAGQIPGNNAEQEIRIAGLIRSFVSAIDFSTFKYHIDIDGNTNSWPGLFQKLLTGSPVLKVASPFGFRQWYYDRLRPWINYVPVSADMSDLVDHITWLRGHDDAARRIGEHGQQLALGLSYESELRAASGTIAAATRYYAGEPEIDEQFGEHPPKHVRLLEGWAAPGPEGAVAQGQESRLDLPQPAAPGPFVLEMDIVPYPLIRKPQVQRIAVVSGGEVLHQGVIGGPSRLRCSLPVGCTASADRYTITMLHPDAQSVADQHHPLDSGVRSIVLRRLLLTASAAYRAESPSASVTLNQPTPAETSVSIQPARCPELIPGPRPMALQTYWGTTVVTDSAELMRHDRSTLGSNAVAVVLCGGHAHLKIQATAGDRGLPHITSDQSAGQLSDPAGPVAGAMQHFEVVPTESSDWFGLRFAGLYLCAEPDGRITLSRMQLGPWEQFRAVADLTQSDASGSHHDAAIRECHDEIGIPGAVSSSLSATASKHADLSMVAKSWNGQQARDLAEAGHVDELHSLLADTFGEGCNITLAIEDERLALLARWDIIDARTSRLVLGRRLGGQQRAKLNVRGFDMLPFIAAYHCHDAPVLGSVALSLEDWGLAPGLTFCDFRRNYFLIPDSFFLATRGYEQTRRHFADNPVPWGDRQRVVFWRGHDFGPATTDWRTLPRTKLCALANDPRHRSLFDVGIALQRSALSFEALATSGYIREVIPVHHFSRYRYHIDIDGRTNSWPGLFQKLLTGSPVLKVASERGYRQWYYDRLIPWKNFVPVATDLSDLVEKSEWLLSHDEQAEAIGAAGRALAESMTYEGELRAAANTASAAIAADGRLT